MSHNENLLIEKIIEKTKTTVKKHNMLCEEDVNVVVGLSGGADSMMLTHLLKNHFKLNIFACHINHKLRGAESERDMNFVKNFCEKNNIHLETFEVDAAEYAQQHKISIEQAGRFLRYDFFAQTAKHFSCTKIVTAHTLSDNVETIVFNLSRGTSLKGLCGIPPIRDNNIIRPLIELTREEIEQYCELYGINYITDSTNLETVYTRNKIRHKVIPRLKEINPQLYSSINNTVSVLLNEQDYMNAAALEAFDDAYKNNSLDIDFLKSAHSAIRNRVIAIFLEKNNFEKRNYLIEKINAIISLGEGKINIKNNIFIEVKKNFLLINDNALICDYFEQEFSEGTFINPMGKRYEISIEKRENIDLSKKVYKKLLYILIDYDKIIGKLILRQRKNGDKITFIDRQGTRALKKLFINDKLAAVQKSNILVLSDDNGVVGVEDYGVDKRVCVDEATRNVLIIKKLD